MFKVGEFQSPVVLQASTKENKCEVHTNLMRIFERFKPSSFSHWHWLMIHRNHSFPIVYSIMINLKIIIILLCFIKLSITLAITESENFFLSEEQENIFTNGVAVDYSFNETLSQTDSFTKFISVPGCPESTKPDTFLLHGFNRNFWVQYGSPPRCYLVGIQGPCPNGTLMGPLTNSTVGICVCRCFVQRRTTPLKLTEESLCYDSGEGQHHALINGMCHIILSQGGCKPNEVLLFDGSKNRPVCKFRDCPKEDIDIDLAPKYSYRFRINNTCHRVGGLCDPYGTSTTWAPIHWVFDVEPDSPFPSCVQKYGGGPASSFGGVLNEYSCDKQLEKYSQVLNKCVPIKLFGRRRNIG